MLLLIFFIHSWWSTPHFLVPLLISLNQFFLFFHFLTTYFLGNSLLNLLVLLHISFIIFKIFDTLRDHVLYAPLTILSPLSSSFVFNYLCKSLGIFGGIRHLFIFRLALSRRPRTQHRLHNLSLFLFVLFKLLIVFAHRVFDPPAFVYHVYCDSEQVRSVSK